MKLFSKKTALIVEQCQTSPSYMQFMNAIIDPRVCMDAPCMHAPDPDQGRRLCNACMHEMIEKRKHGEIEPGVLAVLDGLLPVLPPPVAVVQDVVDAPRLEREPRPARLLLPRPPRAAAALRHHLLLATTATPCVAAVVLPALVQRLQGRYLLQ